MYEAHEILAQSFKAILNDFQTSALLKTCQLLVHLIFVSVVYSLRNYIYTLVHRKRSHDDGLCVDLHYNPFHSLNINIL